MRLRAPTLAILGAALVFAGGAFLNREFLTLAAIGANTPKRTLAEQQALLAPHVRVFAPQAGAPPYPAVLQFHGCAGYRDDFMEQWAKVGNEAGFLVIAIDSAAPRGLDRDASISSVCEGKTLVGQERAGDVAAALDDALRRRDVDPERIVVAGWSHGAWSIMDYLALSAAGRNPPSIAGEAPSIDPAGVILFYPYCGPGSWSRIGKWTTKAEMIAFIAGDDAMVDGPQCRSLLETKARAGAAIDLVYYPQAGHVFDDAGLLGGEYGYLYRPEEAEDAAARYAAFLARIRSIR